VELHVKCGVKGTEEVIDEFHARIISDMTWDTMLGKDMKNEELFKSLRSDGIVSRDEE